MKKLARLAATFIVLLLLGCAAPTARLYNLETGEVLHATYQGRGPGHGQITVTTPAGETLVGEYTTFTAVGSPTFGTATVSGTGEYGWATAQGFSFSQPGQRYGSATVAGDGLIIDIVYVVDPWSGHGHGVGRDNHGGRYKVQF